MSMPVIRLRQSVQFPANVYGGTGIAVSKVNGNYTIDIDYSEFSTLTGLPSGTTTYVLSYDTATHAYVLVPAGNFLLSPSNAAPTMDWVASAGVSALYSRGDHVHPSDTSRVAIVPQTLSAAEQTQARQNVYAAPLDALAYNGMQINGSMDVNQVRGGAATGTDQSYVCDGWKLFVGGPVLSAQQGPGIPIPGIPDFTQIAVTTGAPSLAAGNYSGISQGIEGYRIKRLAWGSASAQSITLCFWSAHFRTGLYSGTIRNAATNRTYAFTYTQGASNVTQYNTITIPGDTAGTWLVDNNVGMYVVFSAGTGSTYTAPSANSWLSGSYHAAPGQVNGVAATSDVFRITGVVILPGIEAPSAARSPFIMRPYDQELVTCRRYFGRYNIQPFNYMMTGLAYAATAALFTMKYQPMRTSPTFTSGPVADFSIANTGTDVAINSFTATLNSEFMRLVASVTSGLTAGQAVMLQGAVSGAGGTFTLDAGM